MKKVKYSLLFLCLMAAQGLFAQNNQVVITGMVGFTQSNFPVPGIDLTFTSSAGELQTVFTDDLGMYSVAFDIAPGQTDTYTAEVLDLCLGTIFSETVTASGPDTINLDFLLCDGIFPPPPSDCDAHFHWEQDFDNPLMVYFTDLSFAADDIDSWSWDFGDGATSTEQNPEHTYAEFGEYFVTLTIVSDSCSSTITQHVNVEDFSTSGCDAFFFGFGTDGLTYQFVDFSWTASGTIDSWSWDFGDGSTSSEPNPWHTYAAEGVYVVTLTITADSCTSTFAQDIDVQAISIPDCHASFFPSFTSNPLEVQFNDLSDGAVVSWEWNFGNGEISTEQNPLYYYADEGVYEVTLTITTIDGCVSTYVSHVYVGNPGTPPPLACQAFFFFEQDPVDMMTFNFINFSFGTDLEYEWNFGDGTTSTEMKPTHTYSEDGLYQVDLTVSNDSCSNTMSMIIITDWDIWYDTECNAVFLPVIIPDSNQVFFLNFSSTDALTFEWDFGDGTTSTENSPVHTYDSAGVYTVLLEITTATGCTSSFEVTIDLHNSGFTGDATSSAIQLSTATEEANTFEQITMYPNPMSDQLMIDLGNNIDKEVAYRLFNTAGQLVKSGQLQGSNTIDVSNLLDGFYIIQLNGDGVEYQEKLIKQR